LQLLIACLGNIGHEYALTRHNIGFMVADKLATDAGEGWKTDRYGDTCTLKNRGRTYHLLKPNTYMNLSGKAVAYHLERHKLKAKSMIVVTDDLALPFGTLRLRPKGSDGGHNGLKNISELLATQDYPRLRVGIGSNFPTGRQVDYVLSPFSELERIQLPLVVDAAAEAVLHAGFAGIDAAMTRYNKNILPDT